MAAEVTEEEYDDWLDGLGESAISSYSAGWLFKRADSIAYQMGLNEYMDEMEEECRPTPPDFEPCYTEREIEDIYDEMLEDSLGTDWLADRYSISWLIKRADPTAYRVGFNDYEDMMTEDNEAETFAAHEPNCDCYGCEQKKWDARSYWEKQILLDNPEERHMKSRDLGWNETRKCAKCAKYDVDIYGAKVSQYNDGLRIYQYDDCGCWVYDHSIRNRRQKKWRKQRSRIAQEKYKEEREQQPLNREETERRRKSRKKWWQFWRAESYDSEYNFVMSDIGEADERVEEKLDDGWKLYGDPVVFEKQDFTVFGQGMTKEVETFNSSMGCESSCPNCGGSPYGCGGDYCPYCGVDWKENHRPDCMEYTGCDHKGRMSYPIWDATKEIWCCANCEQEMPQEEYEDWLNYDWWKKFSGHPYLPPHFTESNAEEIKMSKPIGFYAGVVGGLMAFLALRSYFHREG